jgi:hypothetical protein
MKEQSPPKRSGRVAQPRVTSVDRLLRKTRKEIIAAKGLLKEEKRRAKRKLARENAKRATKLVKETMESIEDHHDLLIQQKRKSSGGKKIR